MNKGKICISVCAETVDEMLEQTRRAEDLADFVELRFDCLKENEFYSALEKISCNENYIFTLRSKKQGGKRELSLKEREEFWNSGYDFCGGDFEEDVVENAFYWFYKPVICSYHDFEGVPDNLFEIYERLKATEVDIIKIAVQADDITDTIAVWKLLKKSMSEKEILKSDKTKKKINFLSVNKLGLPIYQPNSVQEIIPIAMGEAGKWTRILGLAHGAFMTYASLDAGKETASGQIGAQDLIETYRVKELDEQTEIYGIVGNPVAQSLSPFMHNAAFKFYNLNAVYIPFEVKNLDAFIGKFLKESGLDIKGFSVTIPHKQAIIKHLDFIDKTAKTIGAVNTVKIVGGKLHGYNTDADGFIAPLRNAYGDLKNVKVAVLGNGGAARACIYALKRENADVTIFARDLAKAEILANEFEIELKELTNADFDDFEIVVNATALGMKGFLENETPAVAEQIRRVKLVYDLVYNPFETRFLKEAKSVFVPTIGGMAMLVAQAVKQFEIWTGKDAPMKEMSATVLKRLG